MATCSSSYTAGENVFPYHKQADKSQKFSPFKVLAIVYGIAIHM